MLKKLILWVLALSLVSLPTLAAPRDGEVALLDSLGIFEGYEDGTYRLENNLTRAEFTKVAIMASDARKSVSSAMSTSPYADVPHSLWSAPYIRLAAEKGYVNGYLDSTFRPDLPITFAESTAVFLRLLGYTNSDFGSNWPTGHMAIAKDIGLLDGIFLTPDDSITRGDTVTLLCNLLETNMKDTKTKYLSVLDCTAEENVIIRATRLEDATVAENKVLTSLGTYKKGANFSPDWVGKTGKLYLENGDTVKAFLPDTDTFIRMETYVVYSALGDGIITYQNGRMEKVTLSDGLPIYKNNSPSGSLQKSQLKMGDILKVVYDDTNNPEYVIRDAEGLSGPYTATASWRTQIPVNADTFYIRNGEKVSASAIENYDILYYAKSMNMVLSYTDRVTGIYKNATPSKEAPASVTVSGNTYAIESVAAFQKLGTGGTFSFGDTVTLLLGREGAVADVLSSQAAGTMAGFVVGTGTNAYMTNLGQPYSGYSITILCADGQKLEFEADADYERLLNKVVTLTFSDGKASLREAGKSSISGTFRADALTLGTASLSPDVQILDTFAPDAYTPGTGISVFPKRLDGVSISNAKILYAGYDAKGRISELILNDVTGDIHDYGIVRKATTQNAGMQISGTYEYVIGSAGGTFSARGQSFSVGSHTPAKFTYTGGQIYSITPLSELSGAVQNINDTEIIFRDGSRYDIAEADIYLRRYDNSYALLKPGEVSPEKYSVSAYYDASAASGGKIRVIIAKEV